MEQNFEKLEELIKDDDKIATVASFAFEARISLAESKEVLDKYVEINKGSKDIHVTYILNGKRKDEDKLCISLVKDDDLNEEKKLYEEGVKQIIFSIQKAEKIDYNVIALVDPVSNEAKKDPISGFIVGKKCLKRTLRKKVLPTLPPATVKGKSTIFTKQNSAVKSESVKVERDNGDTNQANKNKTNTQGNIASLFNKAAQNKKPEQKGSKQVEKKPQTNGGLSNFFTKHASKDTITKQQTVCKEEKLNKKEKSESKNGEKNKDNYSEMKKEEVDSDTDIEILKDVQIETKNHLSDKLASSKKQNKKSDLFDSDTDDEILKDIEIKEPEKKTEKKTEPSKPSKNSRKTSQKKKRGKSDVENDKSNKKRRRIIVEESDSDDILGSDKSDSEDVIEKSDEEIEPVKIEKKPLAPKNKRRKAVDKTYLDEDGYVVTKTEYVYETPSEDENEPEAKVAKVEEKPKAKIEKKGSNNSENDISPNKGAKNKKAGSKNAPAANQPTLMSFFKKK